MSQRFVLGFPALCLAYFLGAVLGHSAWATPPSRTPADATPAADALWGTDYAAAMATAEQQGKMLVIFFFDPAGSEPGRRFEALIRTDATLRTRLQGAVAVKVPLDAHIQVQGQPVTLIEHPAYAPLGQRAGLAVLDFAHKESRLYGRVVSCFPLTDSAQDTLPDFAALLNPANPAKPSNNASLANTVQPASPVWLTDYPEAMEAARTQGKLMLVYFTADDPRCAQFDGQTLADPAIVARMQDFVTVKLPTNAKIPGEEQEVELLKHPAFAEMLGLPGLAILDFAHKEAPYYGCVVSAFPFLPNLSYTSREMAVILDLPPGTLTQRTLIYAVRIHPERPASANGTLDPNLVSEAKGSADYQARIGRQGHHFWETRFHRINALLPFGLLASEVCAESWPGEGLLQAAIECVRCWRLSPGHWGAVRAPHQVYGYDMKRGANGIWYATGIFGKQERR